MELFLPIEGDVVPQHRRSSAFHPGGGGAGHAAARDRGLRDNPRLTPGRVPPKAKVGP